MVFDQDGAAIGEDDSGPSPKPDWVIDLNVPPETFDADCKNLFDRIEKRLKSFDSPMRDPEAVLAAVGPLVRELHARGVSAQAIADHSRIRPQGVMLLLKGT